MAERRLASGLTRQAAKNLDDSLGWLETFEEKVVIVTLTPDVFQGSIYSMDNAFYTVYEIVERQLKAKNLAAKPFYPGGIGATGGEVLFGFLADLAKNDLLVSLVKASPMLLAAAQKTKTRLMRRSEMRLAKRWNNMKPYVGIILSFVIDKEDTASNIRCIQDLLVLAPTLYDALERDASQFDYGYSISTVNRHMEENFKISFKHKPSYKSASKAISTLVNVYTRNGSTQIVV